MFDQISDARWQDIAHVQMPNRTFISAEEARNAKREREEAKFYATVGVDGMYTKDTAVTVDNWNRILWQEFQLFCSYTELRHKQELANFIMSNE